MNGYQKRQVLRALAALAGIIFFASFKLLYQFAGMISYWNTGYHSTGWEQVYLILVAPFVLLYLVLWPLGCIYGELTDRAELRQPNMLDPAERAKHAAEQAKKERQKRDEHELFLHRNALRAEKAELEEMRSSIKSWHTVELEKDKLSAESQRVHQLNDWYMELRQYEEECASLREQIGMKETRVDRVMDIESFRERLENAEEDVRRARQRIVSAPTPNMTPHLSDGMVETIALKAVTRISSLPPRSQAQAWELWEEEIRHQYGALVAQELMARAAELRGMADK